MFAFRLAALLHGLVEPKIAAKNGRPKRFHFVRVFRSLFYLISPFNLSLIFLYPKNSPAARRCSVTKRLLLEFALLATSTTGTCRLHCSRACNQVAILSPTLFSHSNSNVKIFISSALLLTSPCLPLCHCSHFYDFHVSRRPIREAFGRRSLAIL